MSRTSAKSTYVASMTMTWDEVGPHGAPMVLCLPWFGTSRAMTRRAFGSAFKGTAVHQLYADLPGHGDTEAITPPTSETVLDTVVAFIEQRTQEQVLLASCSYGGYLASARGRRRPDLIRGLLLVCPGVRQERDLPAAVDLLSEPGWPDAAPPGLKTHFDQALGRRTRDVVQVVAAALASGGSGDEEYQDELQGSEGYFFGDDDHPVVFDAPVAVATGRQDPVVGYADQFRRMSLYRCGTFVAADQAGHYLPFEQPDLLRTLTLEWLQRCGVG